jgi:hypothetical protein
MVIDEAKGLKNPSNICKTAALFLKWLILNWEIAWL